MKLMMHPVPAVEAFYPPASAGRANDLRLTAHCLTTGCEDGTLLYHTLTGALVLLEHGETVESAKEELAKLHFFVDRSADENRLSREVQTVLGITQSGRGIITSYTVFTTTDCNARCFYCYEKGIRRFSMDEKTANDTADYIIRSCGGSQVSLHWFGGEPLANERAIDVICRRLGEAGVPYISTIITNGYLFDDPAAAKAKQLWRLKQAHITLDGTKEVYQRTKAYVNGDPQAYERVLGNIDRLTENGISVLVRLNLNRDNDEDIMRLCDELGERFGGKRNIQVSPVLLRQHVDDVHPFATPELAAAHYTAVREKLRSLGLLHAAALEPKLRLNACMADNESSIVIYPDGTLGKCEHYNENEIIGSIYGGEPDHAMIRSWKKRKSDIPLCGDCPLVPQCIQPEKCPNIKDGCTPVIKQLRIANMTDRVLKTYRDRKE